MAMEVGRPMLIADEDCDTEYPEPLEDEDQPSEAFHPQNPALLLATIHVARLLAPLARLCRSLCITAEAIKKYEAHLSGCMQLFPAQLQLSAKGPLDPFTMAPLLHFQNTRLLLYRHNMSPACSSEQRTASIDNCVLAAQATASVLSRCFLCTDSLENGESRLRASASFQTCTHLWRCMLFLAFRQDWSSFYIILRYVAVIGDSKPINTSCGRHLSLFLHLLIDKHRQGNVASLEDDEDLVVLLSGDLQAGTSSWVWGTTETGTLLSRRQKHSRAASTPREMTEPSPTPLQITWDALLTDEDRKEWGGWQKLYEAAQWLEEFQRAQFSISSRPQANQRGTQSIHTTQKANENLSTRSRMAIASITDT